MYGILKELTKINKFFKSRNKKIKNKNSNNKFLKQSSGGVVVVTLTASFPFKSAFVMRMHFSFRELGNPLANLKGFLKLDGN